MFDEMMNRFPHRIIYAMRKTPQNLQWHPEGDVLAHTRLVFEEVRKTPDGDNIEMLVAALFHDMGKIDTTVVDRNGKISSPGHENLAWKYIKEWKSLFPEVSDWDKVEFLCKHHMKMHLLNVMRSFKVEELKKSPYWTSLVVFGICDDAGRGKGAM